jgi:hypothetical protein
MKTLLQVLAGLLVITLLTCCSPKYHLKKTIKHYPEMFTVRVDSLKFEKIDTLFVPSGNTIDTFLVVHPSGVGEIVVFKDSFNVLDSIQYVYDFSTIYDTINEVVFTPESLSDVEKLILNNKKDKNINLKQSLLILLSVYTVFSFALFWFIKKFIDYDNRRLQDKN